MRKNVIVFVTLTVMYSITSKAASVKKPSDGSDEHNVCPKTTTCDLSLPIRHHLHTCLWNLNCKPNFQCCHTACSPNKICVPVLNPNNVVLETNVNILANDDDNVKIILNQDNQTDKNLEHLSNHHKHTVEGHSGMIVNVFHHIIKKYYINHLNIYYRHHNNNVLTPESETTEKENVENMVTEKPHESIIIEKESSTENVEIPITKKLQEAITEVDTNVEKPDESVTEKETIEIVENKKNLLHSCNNIDDEDCLNAGSGLGTIPEKVISDESIKDEDIDSFSGSGDVNLNNLVNAFDPKDSIMFKTSDGKIVIIGEEIQLLEEPSISDEQKCDNDNDCKNSEIEF